MNIIFDENSILIENSESLSDKDKLNILIDAEEENNLFLMFNKKDKFRNKVKKILKKEIKNLMDKLTPLDKALENISDDDLLKLLS